MREANAQAVAKAANEFLDLVGRSFRVLDESGHPIKEPPNDRVGAREAVLDSARRLWLAMDIPRVSDDQRPFVVPEKVRRREETFRDLYNGFHALIGRWRWGFFIEEPTLRLPMSPQDREGIYSIELAFLKEAIARLTQGDEAIPSPTEPPVPPSFTSESSGDFAVDRDTFSVRWRGRVCELGNTMVFRLIERLARQPGNYVSLTTLMEDVWEDTTTSGGTVQRTVSHLRGKLSDAGMAELQIDGRQHGHYRLVLPDESRRPG